MHVRLTVVAVASLLVAGGCATTRKDSPSISGPSLRLRAMRYLGAAVRYEHNPLVRAEAVEALETSELPEGKPWIRAALLDDSPGVRFAACMAEGRLGDRHAGRGIRRYLDDPSQSVQLAALFALHRLGDQSETGRIPGFLFTAEDASVRRNAALVLGLLGEPSAIKVLARAMKDADPGVRQHALEAMARLGNREARQELVFATNAGVGSDEVFAIRALAETGDPAFIDTFRYKLATAPHLETKLAAARGLGALGSDEGFQVAVQALRNEPPPSSDPDDPAAEQRLRRRQMAAAALGAIGRTDALPLLTDVMDNDADPRVQVSAARAILEILKADRRRVLSPTPAAKPRRD